MKYTVAIVEETTSLYHVDARNGYEAVAAASVRHNATEPKADHRSITKTTIGKPRPTLEGERLEHVAGADEHAGDEVATRRIKDHPQA